MFLHKLFFRLKDDQAPAILKARLYEGFCREEENINVQINCSLKVYCMGVACEKPMNWLKICFEVQGLTLYCPSAIHL